MEPHTDPEPTKPRAKAVTATEKHQRVMQVRQLIGKGKRDGEIKVECSKEWGITRKTVGKYLTLARKLMRDELGKPKSELQVEIVENFRELAFGIGVADPVRVRALENMARILGLNQPTGIHIVSDVPKNREEDQLNKLLTDEEFVAFRIKKAAEKDQGAADGSASRDIPEDSDTGDLWADGDGGDEESGAVA